MSTWTAYLFLEAAIVIFFLGFCWEHLEPRELRSPKLWKPAIGLAILWFAIDQVAVRIGLWHFPNGGTFRARVLELPIEECILFFVHTLMCFLLLKLYGLGKEPLR